MSFFTLLVTLLFLPLCWRALARIADPETASLAVLLLLADSMLLGYSPYFYGEPFSALLAALSILWLHVGWNRAAGLALVLSAANMPATLLAAAVLCANWARRKGQLRWLALPMLAGLEILVERALSDGTIPLKALHPGILPFSNNVGYSYPFLFGFLNLMLSFGKGLLFFCPGLILWTVVRHRLRERERLALVDMLLYLGGLLLVYSHSTEWSGDDCWGPRTLFFATVPATVLLAVAMREKPRGMTALLVTLVSLAASAWVGICGTVYQLFGLLEFYWGNGSLQHDYFATYATTEFSPLFHPLVAGLLVVESPVRAVVMFAFLMANLSLAFPLLELLVDRLLSLEIPRLPTRW